MADTNTSTSTPEQAPPDDGGFFATGTTRVPLDDQGHYWCEFRDSLSFRQALLLLHGSDPAAATTPEQRADAAVSEIMAYLVGWNVPMANGQPSPCTRDAVEELKPAAARRIRDALAAHLRRMNGPADAGALEGKAPPPVAAS